MQRVSFAMATNDVRLYLNGMLLHIKSGALRAVGGSSVSMGIAMKDVDGLPAGDTQAIIPAKSAQDMQRLLGDGDTLATVRIPRTQLQVNGSAFRLSTQSLHAGYPDYQRTKQIEP